MMGNSVSYFDIGRLNRKYFQLSLLNILYKDNTMIKTQVVDIVTVKTILFLIYIEFNYILSVKNLYNAYDFDIFIKIISTYPKFEFSNENFKFKC